MANSLYDDNRNTSILAIPVVGTNPITVSGVNLTNANPLHVAIVDGSGTQITSFGGGTQYTDAGTPPAHPIGGTLEFNNAGVWATVGSANPLPVTGTFFQTTQPVSLAVLPSAAALADGTANPTTTQIGANMLAWDGGSFNRIFAYTPSDAANNDRGVLTNSRLQGYNGSTWDRLRADTTNGLWVNVKSQAALPAGTNLIGKVGIDQTTPGTTNATSLAQINAATTLAGNGVTGAGSQRITLASDNSAVALWGHGATASTVPANAVYSGRRGTTALPTAVTDGQQVGAMSDKFGRQVVIPNGMRDIVLPMTQLTLAGTTTETSLVAAVASTFNDLLSIVVINTSTTATQVDFRDSTGGTVRLSLYVPAGDTRGVVFNTPLPQNAVNTAWTAKCGTSVSSVIITGTYIANK